MNAVCIGGSFLTREECLAIHEYEGNICTVCGYVDECAHVRFIYRVEYDCATYETYDQEYHLVTGYRCEYRNCEFCGRYFEDACDTELSSELERHSFEDGECYKCGCINTCAHEITSIYSTYSELEFTPINAYNHRARGYLTTGTKCEICGQALTIITQDALYHEMEHHCFTNGLCEYCGCVNTCIHANVDRWVGIHDPIYEEIDARMHLETGHPYEETICCECGESFFSIDMDVTESRKSTHSFMNGVCQDCGYRNLCSHPEVIQSSFLMDSTYTDLSETQHEATGNRALMKYCVVFRETLEETISEQLVTEIEAHFYSGNGSCLCGRKNTCKHDCDVIYDQNFYMKYSIFTTIYEATHFVEGLKEWYTECKNCGQILKTGEICYTEEQLPHEYMPNGRHCKYCGYERIAPLPTEDPDDPYGDSVAYLPDSLDVIDAEALLGIAARTVVIPDGATTIGARAFASYPNLKYVVFPTACAASPPMPFRAAASLSFAAPAAPLPTTHSPTAFL